MAPGVKRKRGDHSSSFDNNNTPTRPSPYRPGESTLAHASPQSPRNHFSSGNDPSPDQLRGRGGRRGGRGGRGAHQTRVDRTGGQDTHNAAVEEQKLSTEPSDAQMELQQPSKTGDQDNNSRTEQQTISNIKAEDAPTSTQLSQTTVAATSAANTTPSVFLSGYFHYEYLTTEVLNSWKEQGRAKLIEACASALSGEDYSKPCIIFQELLRAAHDKVLDAADAGKVVEEVLVGVSGDGPLDGPSMFLDTVSVFTDTDVSSPQIKTMILSTGISAQLMRELLEEPMLQALGLIRPTFGRVFIRKQTNLLYRQSNYNLLREETEGFSKLMTEMFTTTNNEPPSEEVVIETFENVKALIGAFDLDAGRVLDVTLDVFASLLVKHYRFFVKYLRSSSYWPHRASTPTPMTQHLTLDTLPQWAQPGHSHWVLNDAEKEENTKTKTERDERFWKRAREVGMVAFFELGGRELQDEQQVQQLLRGMQHNDSSHANETKKWLEITHTLPPPGNSIAAQLLGFKLRFYASAARDPTDVLPVNLLYLAALLIKIGFISLRDLYSHLHPDDEGMEHFKEKQMKEREERERQKRPGMKLNALSRAGALVDDTLPPAPISRLREGAPAAGTTASKSNSESKASTPIPKSDEEEEIKEQLPEPADQKVQLLKSLLCIGAIPESLYMLGRFPWLPDAIPDLPEHINRILHHCLAKIHEPLCSIKDHSTLRETSYSAAPDTTGPSKAYVRLMENPPPKVLRWAQLDKNDQNEGIDYKFYWDDWADNVPVCQTVDDVFTLCNTLLNYCGVKIGLDSKLLMKLARIGKKSITEDNSERNRSRWYDLCKRLLCPALSMTGSNPGVVNEVYDLLKHFSIKARYSLYAEWFQGPTARLPDIANAFALVKYQTRDVLKRIAKTNTKQMARALAKVACASPGIVFDTVFTQIESYDNLIDVVVECGRYFTYMGYDVLTWSLMTFLSRQGKKRISETGLATSSWLQALALFSGKIFKRYSSMNPLPVLQYIIHQLRHNDFSDLIILREIMVNMIGISADTDFTESQVLAMAGGELLQTLTLKQLHDRRYENKNSAKRLTRTLVDNDLTSAFMISIAQQRQMCIFNPEEQSTKLLSEKYDELHLLLVQYLDMLTTHLPIEEFRRLIPNIKSLVSEYGIDASIAMTVHRRSVEQSMADHDRNNKAERKMSESQQHLDFESKPIATDSKGAEETTDDADEPMQDVENIQLGSPEKAQITEGANGETALFKSVTNVWHPALVDLMEDFRAVLPLDFEESLSISFYVTFWQLSISDIMAPSGSYDSEIKRQKDRLSVVSHDRSDISISGLKKKESEKKAINETLDQLSAEMGAHVKNYQIIRRRLDREKDLWFRAYEKKSHTLNVAILQECFLPRLLLSPLDSYYTQKMLFLLHSIGAPGFRTMHFLDRLFVENTLINIIFQCSNRESENFGRFLKEILKVMSEWHQDRAMYEKRAFGAKRDLPGFALEVSADGKPQKFLEYEDFRRLLYKWHKNLFDCVKSCISNGEYMHVKNTINILRAVSKYFPVVNWMGSSLVKAGEDLVEIERPAGKGQPEKPLRRPDLWVALSSYILPLKRCEKDWIMPQAFRQGLNDGIPKNTKSNVEEEASTADPTQTQPTEPTSLNASAPPFQPKGGSTFNPNEKPATESKTDTTQHGEASVSNQSSKGLEEATHLAESSSAAYKTSEGTLSEVARKPATSQPNVEATQITNQIPNNHEEDQAKLPLSSTKNVLANSTLPSKPDSRGRIIQNTARGKASLPSKPEPYHSSRGRNPPSSVSDRVSQNSHDSSGPRSRPIHDSRAQPSRSTNPVVNVDASASTGDTLPPPRDDTRNLPRVIDRETRSRFEERDLRRPPDARYDAPEQSTSSRFEPAGRRPREYPHDDVDRSSYPSGPTSLSRQLNREPDDQSNIGGQSYGAQRAQDERTGRVAAPDFPSNARGGNSGPPYRNASGERDGRLRTQGRRPADEGSQSTTRPLDPPRGGRGTARSDLAGSRSMDSMQPPPFSRFGNERGGRANQDLSHPPPHQDPNYGRLNADTFQSASPPSKTADRHNSAGSQAARQDHRHGDSGPPTPTSAHPDRPSRPTANGSSMSTKTKPTEPPSQNTAGVHPDRLRQIEGENRPPPLQTGSHFARSNANVTSPANAPSGPRSAHLGDSAARNQDSISSSNGPPSGPATSNLGGARRQFAGLQERLHQGGQQNPSGNTSNNHSRFGSDARANDQGTSIRGRANHNTASRSQGGPYASSTTTGTGPNTQSGSRPGSSSNRDIPRPADGPARGQLAKEPYAPRRGERESLPSLRSEQNGRDREREARDYPREPAYPPDRGPARDHDDTRPPYRSREQSWREQPPKPELERPNRGPPPPDRGSERPTERERTQDQDRFRNAPRDTTRDNPQIRSSREAPPDTRNSGARHRESDRDREPARRSTRSGPTPRGEEQYPPSYLSSSSGAARGGGNDRRELMPPGGRDGRDMREGVSGSMNESRKRGYQNEMGGDTKRSRRSGP